MFDTLKTRMIELPYGEETLTICSVVSIEYRNVTDRQTDGRTDTILISISRVSMLTRDNTVTYLNENFR